MKKGGKTKSKVNEAGKSTERPGDAHAFVKGKITPSSMKGYGKARSVTIS